jgi:hypothetical protein
VTREGTAGERLSIFNPPTVYNTVGARENHAVFSKTPLC